MQCSLKSGIFFVFIYLFFFVSKFCGVSVYFWRLASLTTIHGKDVLTPLILPLLYFFSRAHEYGNLPNMVPETSELPRIPGPPKQGTNPRPPSANTIRKHAQKSLDESSQRLKAIEVIMNMLIACKKKTDHVTIIILERK